MHGNDDFQAKENDELPYRFPRFGNEMHDAARSFKNQERQPEMAQDTEGAAAAAAIDVQLGLDFGFEDFQVLVNAPGGHATEFAVNERKVGKNGQAKG